MQCSLIQRCNKSELLVLVFVAKAYHKPAEYSFYCIFLNYTLWCGTLVRLVRTFQKRTNIPVPVPQQILRTVLFAQN